MSLKTISSPLINFYPSLIDNMFLSLSLFKRRIKKKSEKNYVYKDDVNIERTIHTQFKK